MSPTELLYHQGTHSAAYRGPGRQLAQDRSPDLPESQLGGQASNTARNSLHSEEQERSQQQVASNTLQDVAGAQESSAAAAVVAADTRLGKSSQTDMLPSNIQQYQPGSMPSVDEDRLISAAVTQASHLMGDTVLQYEAEDQFDAWPLINPPFQEALHEVSQTRHSSEQ